ncbi:hypothetical protein M404DRAFT_19467 [Pisolithus tinctorius Marx 270]|uniref:Uncharacterized protein n=1 Tax=Pisolithus tinctorius Marx 270 TaxID=870435 RepID=A0A0C3JU94_PISTI|nr:hypothetical protein M404DRAFT_19467 [Pisolithus tinctorius Marx 270]
MRRLASVFVSRSDRPDAPSTVSNEGSQPRQPKGPGVLASLARRATQTSIPSLLPSSLTNSSSSSSSGSTALQTPIDESLPRKSSKKGSWASWIAPKKQARREAWSSCAPPFAALSPPNVDLGNETLDARSSPSDDGSDHSESQSSQMVVRARANTRIILWNSLVHRLDSPPLLDLPEFVAFPRSCNPCRSLRRKETLESKVHKNALLSRLDKLSPSELSSIMAWSTSVVATKKPSRDPLHDFFPEARAIARHSEGLRTWVSRPYYEERVYVWTQEEKGEIACSRVTGPQLGVAALEYSEVLDILSGPLSEPPDEPSDGAIFDTTAELLSLPCIPGLDCPAVQTSPLKSSSRSVELFPPSTMTSASPPALLISETIKSETKTNPSGLVPKKGVRFAEDDSKDDKIPLGYMLRVRKNKEQKAKFLRHERERRAIVEAEVASQEEERARREFEKLEMDKLRRAREQERKQLEEQERQRNYLEEVQATRIRREAARAGQARIPPTASYTRPLERDWSESRNPARPPMRRDGSSRGSEPVPVMNVPSYDASPASSLPPTPGSQRSFSRPPSVYSAHTASSEDVRNREARRISRRSSTVSDSSKHAAFQVPYNYGASLMAFNPSWGMIPPVPPVSAIPPVPAIPPFNTTPFYGMEMPLLPPTAPFMVDQYRSRSPGSRSSSSTRDPPRHQLSQTVHSDGASSGSKFSTHGTKSNSPHRRSTDGLSPATASGKSPLECSTYSQYDLRSPPSYPNSSRTDLRHQPGTYPEPRASSPRHASITPSHASQSQRRIVIS